MLPLLTGSIVEKEETWPCQAWINPGYRPSTGSASILGKKVPLPRLLAPTRQLPRSPPGCSDGQTVLDGLKSGYRSIFTPRDIAKKTQLFRPGFKAQVQ